MTKAKRSAPMDGLDTTGLERREVVKLLGLAPLVGVLEWTGAEVDRAARLVRELPGNDAAAAFAPKFFTDGEYRTVRLLADYVVPRDERSGSATDAKVPEFMDFMLSNEETEPATGVAIRGGLAWLDTESRRRHGATFVECTDAQRRALLDDIAWPAKARPEMSHGVAFFNRFRDMVASGFWSSAVGYQDLQYKGNTFVPEWTGCPEAALQKLGVSYEQSDSRTSG